MAVPVKMSDLATLAASNSPQGSDAIGNSLDDYLRAVQAIVRSTNALSSATIASGSTTDLGTSDAEAVTVTGTTTITSFGTSVPGLRREVTFSGVLTITNSASIVLTGGTSITTVAGDVITFRSLGAGVWTQVASARVLGDINASGKVTVSASDATIATSGNPTKGLVVQTELTGGSAKAAYINFLRVGNYSFNVGIDSDNFFKIGGGSLGLSYKIAHEGLAAFNLAGTFSTGGATTTPEIFLRDVTNGGQLNFVSSSNTSKKSLKQTPGGVLQFINSAYTVVISTLDDSGNWSGLNFTATSDRRKKKKIKERPARDRLADLLIFCEWLWKGSNKHGLGVIAQEVQKVAPEYVYEGEDGTLSVDKASLALECVIGLAGRVRALEGSK